MLNPTISSPPLNLFLSSQCDWRLDFHFFILIPNMRILYINVTMITFPNRWTSPFLNVRLLTSTYPTYDYCVNFFLNFLATIKPSIVLLCAWVRVIERKNLYSRPDLPSYFPHLPCLNTENFLKNSSIF